MGFLNKIIGKSDKGNKKQADVFKNKKKVNVKDEQPKKREMTIAELKDKSETPAKPSFISASADKKATAGQEIKKPVTAVKKDDTKDAYKVLIRPLITEKGTYLGAQNKYIFEVALHASKLEIKKAVKAVYGVTPISVNIINLSGRKVRYGRVSGTTKSRKKAIITLKKEELIEVYEGV